MRCRSNFADLELKTGHMKTFIAVLLIFCVVEYISADASYERRLAIEKRIHETRPQRRDTPLRLENIRDEEVTEIRAAARGVVPEALVNIGPVVTGCLCEEGPSCTDQVWILASRDDKTVGLQLSKIDGHWRIGRIQQWWLELKKLPERSSFHPEWKFELVLEAVEEKFPHCAAGAEEAAPIRQP
jgi:hypothetical protein